MRNEVYFEYGVCDAEFAKLMRTLDMPVPIMATARTTISVSELVITKDVIAAMKKVLDEQQFEGYEKTAAQYVGHKVVDDLEADNGLH